MDLINARENFKTLPDNKTSLRVYAGGDLLSGVEFDDIQATYPTTTTERFDYYLSTVLKASILITYTTSSKNILLRVQRL